MKKVKVFGIAILSIVILLSIILFGFVFRLRKQSVDFLNETTITEQEILNTASLKEGKATLLINKEQTINKIEQTYANIKVVQIKTVSLFEIKIVVRERYELYYTTNLGKHYVMDEDLKVLRITEIEPTNLIKIESKFSIDTNTKECAFLGTIEQKEILFNLYSAMYSSVITTEGQQARIDVCSNIASVKIEESKLIIVTPEEIIIDIAKPDCELTDKINICYSAINQLKLNGEELEGRTIKIYYNVNGAGYKCSISPKINQNQ